MKKYYSLMLGLLSGIIVTMFWDYDDYGLWLALMPGWLFAITFIVLRIVSTSRYSAQYATSAISWIVFTSLCFWSAFYLTREYGLFAAPVAGFVTTCAMLLWYSIFVEKLYTRAILLVSAIAAPISFAGIYFFLANENTWVLFVSYYTILIWVFAKQIPISEITRRYTWSKTIVGLVISIALFYYLFIVLNAY